MSQTQKLSAVVSKLPEMLVCIWRYIRTLICILENLYCIPGYLFLNLILLPLYFISLSTFATLENSLYYGLLYIVGTWSYHGGMVVHEHGDDIYEICRDPDVRVLLIANHQSTADVPLMFQAFASRQEYSLLWIMDRLFKWTNFGLISQMHGDYFVYPKKYKPNSILNHCLKPYSLLKNMIILFPEGGFLYKRLPSSLAFANKKNFPPTKYVTYPRVQGYHEVLQPELKITHVIDLTICYDHPDKAPSILNIVKGEKISSIHFYYKLHSVQDTPNITREEWLYEQWHKKEALLANHYAAIKQRNMQDSPGKLSGSRTDLITNVTTTTTTSSTSNSSTADNSPVYQNNNLQLSTANPLKFRTAQEFADLRFDMDSGRPVKMSFCTESLYHIGYLAVNIIAYAIIILIIHCYK